jgi:hypothetical protein
MAASFKAPSGSTEPAAELGYNRSKAFCVAYAKAVEFLLFAQDMQGKHQPPRRIPVVGALETLFQI